MISKSVQIPKACIFSCLSTKTICKFTCISVSFTLGVFGCNVSVTPKNIEPLIMTNSI